jgi:RES domain-containing protein
VITAWRLDKAKHVKDAFTGEGARRVSGRWHHQGIPVVYVSESLALCVVEKFVHLGFDASHIKFVYFKIEIPDSVHVEKLKTANLPNDWTAEPPSDSTKNIGAFRTGLRDRARGELHGAGSQHAVSSVGVLRTLV